MDNVWSGLTNYSQPQGSSDIPTQNNSWEAVTNYAPTPSQNPWQDFQQKAISTVQSRNFPSSVVPVLLGQAAIESARGTAAPGNNYFGIKGVGTAGSNNLDTQEYGNNGYYGEKSNFRAYNSPEESINDYLDLIMKYPGVPQAIANNNPEQIIQAIKDAGYATSPTYVQNVMATPEYQQNNMTQLW